MLKIKITTHIFSLMAAIFSLLTPPPFTTYEIEGRPPVQLGCPVDAPPPPDEVLTPQASVSLPYRQQAYIKASNTNTADFFGDAVAISGNTLVVGARGESSKAKGVNGVQGDNSVPSAGAAYVFVLSGGVWSQQAYLKSSAPDANDLFGKVVAISGDTIVVGAPEEDSNATGVNGNHYNDAAENAGAVYVFTRTAGVWMQQAYIKASNTQAGDRFGSSVSISGDTLVVGAPGEASNATSINGNQANNAASASGAAYVFTRSDNTWSQQAYIKASNTDMNDQFGFATSISGNTLVVGAPYEASSATGINGNQNDNSMNAAGAAYAFIRNGNVWTQQAYIKASNIIHTDVRFGWSAAISGSTIVVGAPLYPDMDLQFGSAYVFTRSAGIWSEQAQLSVDNEGDCYDTVGEFVAISGDTVILGSFGEDTDDGGVNPQLDYPGENSGAAYAFVRDNNTWTQRAFLKSSNADAGDEFGRAVAISGNLLVMGAHGESSNATGVDGDQENDSMANAGAVYTFSTIPAVYTSELTSVSPTTANTVDFKVTFSDASTGVDVGDFKATASSKLSGVSILGISGGPKVYTVTVATGSGNGTIRLDVLDDDSIRNTKNVPLGGVGLGNGSFSGGDFYIVRLQTRVFRSQAALDGWILEATEHSNTGGSIDSTASLISGDDAANKQYRSIVSFDTASLPDTAIIFSGTFKLRQEAIVGTDPFTTHGRFHVDICEGFFGSSPQLGTDDYKSKASYCGGAFPEYHVNGGVWYDIVLGAIERPRVNPLGVTQFRMGFESDDDNDEIADYVSFYSGDATTASYRPALVVEYYEK